MKMKIHLLLCTQVQMKLAGCPGFPEEDSAGFASRQAHFRATSIFLLPPRIVPGVVVQNGIFRFGEFVKQTSYVLFLC